MLKSNAVSFGIETSRLYRIGLTSGDSACSLFRLEVLDRSRLGPASLNGSIAEILGTLSLVDWSEFCRAGGWLIWSLGLTGLDDFKSRDADSWGRDGRLLELLARSCLRLECLDLCDLSCCVAVQAGLLSDLCAICLISQSLASSARYHTPGKPF